ncbi:MAG TPA: IS66 family insertion sequence element accessory protein TnpB [Gemmataceae bacterium]|nr:IS66 family insertion sequence element accessory protein TnpB [Gemmataceae bacterium]
MLTLPPSVKIWCATTPTDLRRGPDGLSGLVRSQLHADPLSGHLFVFFNRKADRLKILYWDRDAICVWYRRLAQLPQFGPFFVYFRPIGRRKSFAFPARFVWTRCSANLPA